MRRTTRPIQIGPSKIELAIDGGQICTKRHSVPIAEFELELKEGRTSDLFRVAKKVAQKTGPQLELRSKSEQACLLLANGTKKQASRAEPIYLDKPLTSHEAFNVIALSTLRHFRPMPMARERLMPKPSIR